MNPISHALLLADNDSAQYIILAIYLAIIVLAIAGLWTTFTKAGQPGWGSIIPIYNIILLLRVAEKPIWWIVLYLIPFVNIVIAIIVAVEIARNFGKGTGFGLGLAFLGFIFFPILGFGSARYRPALSTL